MVTIRVNYATAGSNSSLKTRKGKNKDLEVSIPPEEDPPPAPAHVTAGPNPSLERDIHGI